MSSHRISIIDHEIEEYTHNIYTVTFHDYNIQAMVTHSHSIATDWVTSCSSELCDVGSSRNSGLHIIGLDIGWFSNLHDQDNPVALLQIAVGTRCLIFLFQHESSIPQSLIDFLGNCFYVFVGVGIHDNVRKLVNHHDLNMTNVKDLHDWARKSVIGLKGLAQEILGWEIEKQKWITLNQWNKLWLTSAQVQYACVDAFVSLKIGEALQPDHTLTSPVMQVFHVGHIEAVVVNQLLDVIVDFNPDKNVGAVVEEVDEGLGDARLMLK